MHDMESLSGREGHLRDKEIRLSRTRHLGVCGMEGSKWLKTVSKCLAKRPRRGAAAQHGRLPAGHGGHTRPEMGTEGHVQESGDSGFAEKRKRRKARDLEAEGGRMEEEGCHGGARAQGQSGRGEARTQRSKVYGTISRSQDDRREETGHYGEFSRKGRRVWRFPLTRRAWTEAVTTWTGPRVGMGGAGGQGWPWAG